MNKQMRVWCVIGMSCLCFLFSSVLMAQNSLIFHRSFWTPEYEGLPLSHCLNDGKTCGLKVAKAYCQWMGYVTADHSVIAYNLGVTRFFKTKVICRDWRCSGFKTIRCVGKLAQKRDYRKAHFVFPRYFGHRVDWCLNGNRHERCGKDAAFSFCRRIGYMKTIGFKKDVKAGATVAIGNQRQCFGSHCQGFKYINCYR